MKWATYLAWLSAIVPLNSAFPFPGKDVPGGEQTGSVSSFSVGQVPVHGNAKGGRRRNPAAEYARSLARYNATIPEAVTKAAAASALQSGAVPNSPEANDQEYLSPVSIGTPSQTLMLDFDTGSADLWVFSTELPSSESKGHSPLYNPSKSSTSKQLSGDTWSIQYEDGSGASGNVFSDKVVIGGVTATSQAVEAATSVSTTFTQDTQNDGLVGLAFSSINTVTPTPQKTFFATVMSTLASPVFAAYLKHNAAGVYDFGFIDTSKYSGSLAYAAVNNGQGFWQFSTGSYYVGSTNEGSFGSAIADTGTSIILVDNDVIDAYYDNVSGAEYSNSQGGVIFPCSSTLPSFSVTIGGAKRTCPGSYINYASVGGGYCYGGIQSNEGLSFSILGDVFLKSQYVVFDGGNTRIGFAPQAS